MNWVRFIYLLLFKRFHLNLKINQQIISEMFEILSNLFQHPFYLQYGNYAIFGLITLILYAIYLQIFKYHNVIMNGFYDIKLKKIGKTIPPFPNGWYIACKSKELARGESLAIDQSGHNVVIFRSSQGQVYALSSYCAHLGANLGIGGKVINKKCIQCPFHGWLYDGQTGKLVDHDNKPCNVKGVEYKDEMGSKGCKKVDWKHHEATQINLRKYHTKEVHGFIYLWLHVDPNQEPTFDFLNVTSYQKKLQNRGQTMHTIYSHVQDIPQNGADVFHFKYVHRKPIASINWMEFNWIPKWKRGDDPDLAQLFQHDRKDIRKFKQSIYNNLVKDHKNKEYLSFANIDNYLVLPIIGRFFIFNLTVVQMGPGLVYVFLKTKLFTVLFVQYVQSKQKYKHILYHEMYSSWWLPYWVTAGFLRGEGIQVYNDMLIWDSKKFGNKVFYKDNEADEFILKWRDWFSKYYEGCKVEDGNVDW